MVVNRHSGETRDSTFDFKKRRAGKIINYAKMKQRNAPGGIIIIIIIISSDSSPCVLTRSADAPEYKIVLFKCLTKLYMYTFDHDCLLFFRLGVSYIAPAGFCY